MRITLKDIADKLTARRRSRVSTVRSMFPLVALTFGIIGASYMAGGSSYVILTPTPAYVEAGEEVLIKVEAVAHAPVNTVDIEVGFPQGALKPTAIDTGGSVITLWTIEPKIEGNKVTLRGGVFRKGFIGRHTIATIRAKATEEGAADVLVRNSVFLAGDGKGTPLSIDAGSNQKAAVKISAKGARSSTGTTLSGKVAVSVVTDIDGDNDVDLSDIQSFMKAWQSGGRLYDFTGDGRMTFKDFAVLLSDSFFK
jgi:hypothetical protein